VKAEHLPVRGSNGNVLPTFLPCYEGITEDKAIGTSSWLPFANSIFGSKASGWEILMPAAGLMTWFTMLIVVVRFMPHRIGPTFFRLANAILGLIRLDFATFNAMVPSRHFLH
jgi:hypothetical protein